LAVALGRAGRAQEAISHYQQALKIKPDYVEAREHLDWLLATQRQVTTGTGATP
jgi:tetratricopeptide (TPR) repeat protein